MTTLTQAELDNAHRRRRTSGYTRFQDAIEDGTLHTAQAWIKHPECPYNRFGKNGKPPLASAAEKLYSALKKDADEIGPMPDWWQKIYPGSTHEDWVRDRTKSDERILAMTQQIFDACLDAVDWTHWKSEQVEALLDALPIGVGNHPRHRLLERVLEAGLPTERLTYMGLTVTPAMRSLLRHPYRVEGRAWMDNPLPVDPPGKGPGFLSVLFMQWSRGRIGDRSYWEDVAEKALARGASVFRPVCPRDWAAEDHKERLYGYKTYDPPETLLALAHTLDSPHILASITQHHIDDANRIDSLMSLMKRTGRVHSRNGAEENSKRQEEHAQQLMRMLEGDAENPKLWSKSGAKLMEAYTSELWPHIATQSNSLSVVARKRLMGLVGRVGLSSESISMAVRTMTLPLSAFELIENLREAEADFSQMGIDHDTLIGEAAVALVSTAMSSEYKQNKCLVALDTLLEADRVLPAFHERITCSLFRSPQGGMPLNHLRNLVDLLERKGWKAHPCAWEMIEKRLGDENGRDSAQVLMFLGEVAARHARPATLSILNPLQQNPDPDTQRASSSSAYRDMYPWDRKEALRAHAHIAPLALGTLQDCNARTWGGRISATQAVARFMAHARKAGDTDAMEILFDLIPVLRAKGADPHGERMEDGTPAQWFSELDSDHPFHEAWSRAQQATLREHTAIVPNNARRRRL